MLKVPPLQRKPWFKSQVGNIEFVMSVYKRTKEQVSRVHRTHCQLLSNSTASLTIEIKNRITEMCFQYIIFHSILLPIYGDRNAFLHYHCSNIQFDELSSNPLCMCRASTKRRQTGLTHTHSNHCIHRQVQEYTIVACTGHQYFNVLG